MSLDHNSPADFSPKSLYNQCLQSLGFVIKIRYDRTVPTFEVHIHWIILFTSISVSLSVKKLPDGIEHISDGRRRDGEQRTACNGGEAACCRHKQNRDNISGSHRDHQRQMTAEWSLQLLSTAGVIIIFSPLSLALAGTKQPSQKSLPCSRHWLENDIKPDVVLHLCRKKKRGGGGEKHRAATNDGNEALQGRVRAVASHKLILRILCRFTQPQMQTHTEHKLQHMNYISHWHVRESNNHPGFHDINALWLEFINQKTSHTNWNHISDIGLAPEKTDGHRCLREFFSFCRKDIFHLFTQLES